ncbi:SDR family NAD(P)-dependent oxidoreductase, partial [Streptomyces sp. NPDC058045]|uniref:SDR family NAD(P)-dependent oxidoreductase n=1 Tax=Streptomyces sp. NPDC058045 TaxID=3346311 RepID=UPI0036E4D868
MGTDPVRTVTELLRKHAQERPAAIAYSDIARTITYGELENTTGRLAGHFADWGIKPGSKAIVCLGNRVEMVESALALTRAELIGIPLNPHSSRPEIAHALTDSEAVLAITDEEHAPLFRALDEAADRLHLVVVSDAGNPTGQHPRTHDHRHLRDTEPATPARDGMRPDDLAWMLYTSGTTGTPKGVLSTQHAGLWSAAHGYTALLDIRPGDRLLWPLPLHHSFAFNLCVLGVVTAGASARILADFAADEVLAELRAGQYTLMAAVPAICHRLVDAADDSATALAGLRAFLVAGALTSAALAERFQSAFGIPLIDSYGSSETTGVITCNTLNEARRHGSCGKPVPGITVRVVDPDTRRERATGAEGEIWVAGPSLMTGYHRDPEQTARAFHDGWYRTGDTGALDQDGYLRITGRLKELIIRGGENMHPAEIEDVLRTAPEVADAAVVARPHTRLGEVPVAYLVPAPGQQLPVAHLVTQLRERLAYFKVPTELRLTAGIPRTASGKTIRRLVAEQPSRLLACTATHHPRLLGTGPAHPALPATLPADDTSTLTGQPVLLLSHPQSDADAQASDPVGELADHLTTWHNSPEVLREDTGPEAWRTAAAHHPHHVPVLIAPPGATTRAFTRELAAAGRALYTLSPEPDVTPAGLRDALDAALIEGAAELRVLAADRPASALTTTVTPDPARAERLTAELRTLTGPAQRTRLRALVARALSAVLGTPLPAGADPRTPFRALGFDSLAAVELRNRLVAETGLVLPSSLAFDRPSPKVLADFLGAELLGDVGVGVPESGSVSGVDCDPVVVVGVACRFPGGVGCAEDLWELVVSGGDVVGAFPGDRGWDVEGLFGVDAGVRGTTYAVGGGFLEGVGDFDAEFFGISPREALSMDPQQRLLLRTSWELFENAGIDPESLRGSRTGVFAGQMYHDYAQRLTQEPDLEGYLSTGTAGSVLSGRLSYFYGFEGPALTVDTACSSSLVALHLAVESLRRGECGVAVVGGVTVMSTPGSFVDFARQGGLSVDGRCRAFGAGADGTGWSEGVGLLLVERLSVARGCGHEVLGVVRGSAVNQDGASNGLSAPNGPAQQRVIREALASSGVVGGEVDVVEGHGTGTVLGDPIEAQALLATYGVERGAGEPLWLGSVKSNLGHTQAAAGMAGVIKMLMAMRRGVLPRTLHVEEPTPHVDWSAGGVRLLTEERPWPDTGRPRRAAVSSFGISGTNAHVILEQAPAPDSALRPDGQGAPDRCGTPPLVLSARSEPALRAQAASIHAHLTARPELPLPDAGFALATTRAVLEHRAALPADDRATLLNALAALADGTSTPGVSRGSGTAAQGEPTAFLFSGQGGERAGMGRELYGAFPVFAGVVDEVWGVLGDEGVPGSTGWAQAGLFALEVGLAGLVGSWGVRPDVVLGHSVGEVAAAYVAGVLDLGDAARLVGERGRLMGELASGGGMAAVALPLPETQELCARFGGRLEVGAVNGPRSCVVSGAADAVDEAVELVRGSGGRARRLPVGYGFHSRLMEPMLERFGEVVAGLELREPQIPLVSNVTGGVVGREVTTPDYWMRHARQSVLFHDGIRTLQAQGVTRYLELGPDAVLTALAQECLEDSGSRSFVALQRPGRGVVESAYGALGELFCSGLVPDWQAVYGSSGGGGRRERVALPTYPFQERRYWPSAAMRAISERAGSEEGALYEVAWEPLRLPAVSGAGAQDDGPGRWLAVTDTEDGLTEGCLAALAEAGTEVVRVALPAAPDRADVVRLLGDALIPSQATGIVSLLHGEHAPLHSLLLIQALADLGTQAPLHLVTRGAVCVGARDVTPVRVDGAQIWGLGRVAALEAPCTWGGLMDLPEPSAADAGSAPPEAVTRAFVALLMGGSAEDETAVRADEVLARRLRPATAVPRDTATVERRASAGTVLVTGGTGALGAQVARHLAAAGTAHLLLTGRRGPAAPGAAQLQAELEELGARVTIAACDVADENALAQLLDGIPAGLPLTSVVHTAGVLDDGVLTALTPERLEHVLAAKTRGALHLDRLTRAHPLDTFVLFSSAAGVVGAAGQANYAMANAALDALAVRRRQEGLPATAVAWGAWEGEGMAAEAATVRERMRRTGFRPMRVPAALDMLDTVLREDRTAVLAADVDWETYGKAHGAAACRGALRELVGRPESVVSPGEPEAAAGGFAASLVGRSADEQRALLVELVRRHVAELLMHDSPERIDPGKSFRALGFDSLAAVELRNRLVAETGLVLPSSLAFDRPSPKVLADFLGAELLGDVGVGVPELGSVSGVDCDPVVVVGVACRFPGGVGCAEDLW